MDQSTEVLDVLDEVNDSFRLINKDPRIRQSIVMMLQHVAPLVNSIGPDAHASYIAATQRLANGMQPLVDPRNGTQFDA